MTVTVLIEAREATPYSPYDGHWVCVNGLPAYWRPYDGSDTNDVEKEALRALGALLRVATGHPETPPQEHEKGPEANLRVTPGPGEGGAA